MRSSSSCCVFAAIVLSAPLSVAQVLRRATSVVQTGSSNPRERSDRDDTSSSSSTPSSTGGWSGDPDYDPCGLRLMPFPYAYRGRPPDWKWRPFGGCWWQPAATVYTSRTPTKPVRVVLGIEGGLMLPTVGRVGVATRFDFGDLDLSSRYSWLFEEVDGQLDTAIFGRTDLGIGVQTRLDVELRVRVGFNHWAAGGRHDFGLSAGLGWEIHPGAPYTMNVEAGGGTVGLGGVAYARVVLGMMLGRAELGLGWDHTTLFTRDDSSNVHVTGPIFVTRFWL